MIASLKSEIIDDVWAMFQMMEEPWDCSKWRNVYGLKMSRGLFSFYFCLFLKYVFGVQVSLGKADWDFKDWWNKPAQGCFNVFRVFMFKCLRTAVLWSSITSTPETYHCTLRYSPCGDYRDSKKSLLIQVISVFQELFFPFL